MRMCMYSFPPLECIFWIFRLYLYFKSIIVFPCIPPFLPISRYLSISSHFAAYPLYPTVVSHCIQSTTTISRLYLHYIQLYLLYPAVSHCILPYLTASKTGYNQEYTPPRGAMPLTARCLEAQAASR